MAGPRVFTLEEAERLLPDVEAAFVELDELRETLRRAKLKLSTLEMIWGPALAKSDCPDHEEGGALFDQLRETQEEVAGIVQRLAGMGVVVKDVATGLVDLYHVREGQLVYLCWKRGEDGFQAWHHVDEGYGSRQPL